MVLGTFKYMCTSQQDVLKKEMQSFWVVSIDEVILKVFFNQNESMIVPL